ncbi:MAG TPA: hypothetical protein VF173_02860 [Thermoanaerobaculia bacterium]|nr:hypothetical protein [Thermoanaerobaculia bacterium]
MNEPQTTPNLFRRTLSIESKPACEGQKSRTFSVELLAWVVADEMWELGTTKKDNTHRPVLLAFAGSRSAARSFEANLRFGRTATEADRSNGRRFEIPRSAGFRYEPTPKGEATLTIAYLPYLFFMEPATTEQGTLSFLCMPPTSWIDREATTIARSMGSEAREAAMAAYFVAYLAARCPLPIANDLRFHLALFRAAKEQPWCRVSEGCDSAPGALFAQGLEGIGFEPPVLCNVSAQAFAEFLALQTARNLPRELPHEVIQHGTTRVHRPRRLLSHADAPAAQLSLFGGV